MRSILMLFVAALALVQGSPQNPPEVEPVFDQTQVRFYLYTRNHLDVPQELFVGSLGGSDFLPWKRTQFIVHSHDERYTSTYVEEMRRSFLYSYDSNVIAVDWDGNANGLYGNARDNTRPTGEFLGTFISYLASVGTFMNTTHCVGFGLGAHVCGFAGKTQTGQKIQRITGLEPRDEGFDYNDPTTRLHVNDAEFVDVIHSCTEQYSFSEQIGDADFYPNAGSCDQPGCGWIIDGTCSHERAHEYFTESIKTTAFKSLKCETWEQYQSGFCAGNEEISMGDPCPETALGKYYLYTYDSWPYAMG